MPVFLERFVLTALSALFVAVIIVNPLKLEWPQQVSLSVAVIALAFFVGYTVERTSRMRTMPLPHQSTNEPASPSRATGSATTTGSNSPAVTGDGNTVIIVQPSPQTKPAKSNK